MNTSPNIRHKLDELRPRFLAMVAERLDRFEYLRSQLHGAEDISALLDEIRSGAHRMAGLAAPLGFASLGSHALSADMMLGRIRMEAGAPQPTAEILDAVDLLLEEMARLIHGKSRVSCGHRA